MNGSLDIVFDLVGFELDLGLQSQTAFFTPDMALFFVNPNDTEWKNGTDLVLSMTSTPRPENWKVRLVPAAANEAVNGLNCLTIEIHSEDLFSSNSKQSSPFSSKSSENHSL